MPAVNPADVEALAQGKPQKKPDSLEGIVCSAARSFAVTASVTTSLPIIMGNPVGGTIFALINAAGNYMTANVASKLPIQLMKWSTYPFLHPIDTAKKTYGFLARNPLKVIGEVLVSPVMLAKNILLYPIVTGESSKKGRNIGMAAGGLFGSYGFMQPAYATVGHVAEGMGVSTANMGAATPRIFSYNPLNFISGI